MLLHRVQQFGANGIAGLGPAAWFRYGTGITITGSGVSQWDDQSGNGRHLLQATDANRPQKQADSSILFDGVAYFLKCNAFTLPQPVSLYLLMKQVTWTAGTGICDGNAVSTGLLINRTASPQFALNVGADAAINGNLAVGSYGVVAAQFNGASSSLQINNTAATTGNPGSTAMGGFTLGARGSNTVFANIQAKEAILFAAAHDATQRARVINYLAAVGGIAL
jgi:hypothetical protein